MNGAFYYEVSFNLLLFIFFLNLRQFDMLTFLLIERRRIKAKF